MAMAVDCSESGCAASVVARGLCRRHYNAFRTANPEACKREPKQARPCEIAGCERLRRTARWCSTHYERYRVHGDPAFTKHRSTCSVEGCGKKHAGLGYCQMHRDRLRRGGDLRANDPPRASYDPDAVCSEQGCTKSRTKLSWCDMHYRRWIKHGSPGTVLNQWGAKGQACGTCGTKVVEGSGIRGYCSAKCQQMAYRIKRGEITTHCIDCGTQLKSHQASGRRGNGQGRCIPCADKVPCLQCGGPRTRVGGTGALRCKPCRRPSAVAEQGRRKARLLNGICEHGESCVTASFIKKLRNGADCFYCGEPAEHIDHFYPLAGGGKHCRANLVPACARCNLTKSDRDPWQWLESRVI